MTIVIMAAGMGSRFGSLKQVEPFGPNGEFILDYSVFDAKRAGFDKVIFIIKKEHSELFEENVGSKLKGHIEVEYVYQDFYDIPEYVDIPKDRVKPWGTAHALYSVRNAIKGDFIILNADDFYGREAFLEVYNYLKNTSREDKACMVGFKLKNTLTKEGTVSRGICEVKNGVLVKIDERTKIKEVDGKIKYFEDTKEFEIDEDAIASMNMWGFSREIFKHLDEEMNKFFIENKDNLEKVEFLIPTFIGNLVKNKKITLDVIDTNSSWMGVTYKEDTPYVKQGINNLIEKGIYPNKLW